MGSPNDFFSLVQKAISDELNRLRGEHEEKVSAMTQAAEQEKERISVELEERLKRESSDLERAFQLHISQIREACAYRKKREILRNAIKETEKELSGIDGSERYRSFFRQELEKSLTLDDGPVILYARNCDRKLASKLLPSRRGRVEPVDDQAEGFELGGFRIHFSDREITYDCNVRSRLARCIDECTDELFELMDGQK